MSREIEDDRDALLSAFLDGSLDDRGEARLKDLLSSDDRHVARLVELATLHGTLVGFSRKTPATIRRIRSKRIQPLFWTAAAAAGVLLGAGLLFFRPARERRVEAPETAEQRGTIETPRPPEPEPAHARIEAPPREVPKPAPSPAEPRVAAVPVPEEKRRPAEPPVEPEPPFDPASAPKPVLAPKDSSGPAPRATMAVKATLSYVQGQAFVVSSGKKLPAKAGTKLLGGEQLETVGLESWLVVGLGENTRVELWGNTRAASVLAEAGRFRVERGTVYAEASDPRGVVLATPLGDLSAAWTRTKISVDPGLVVAEVFEGQVRVAMGADGREVAAGNQAVIRKAGVLEVSPLRLAQEDKKDRKGGHPGVDQRRVDQAIEKGVQYLMQAPAAAYTLSSYSFRYDSMVGYTLLHAGVDPDHPVVEALLANALAETLTHTYAVALQAMFLAELDPVRHQKRIAQCCQHLVDNQCADGQWDYGTPTVMPDFTPERAPTATTGARSFDERRDRKKQKPTLKIQIKRQRDGKATGDNSNSMYAVLGLRACMEQANVIPPREILERSMKAWEGTQDRNSGGWHYSGYNAGAPDGVISSTLTAGGVGSLAILRNSLSMPWKNDPAIIAGAKWLIENFSVEKPPKGYYWRDIGDCYYYYMYALERAGILTGLDRFGAHDWYREGAVKLLALQEANGSWTSTKGETLSAPLTPAMDTCWAILFLRRATKPLLPVATVPGSK